MLAQPWALSVWLAPCPWTRMSIQELQAHTTSREKPRTNEQNGPVPASSLVVHSPGSKEWSEKSHFPTALNMGRRVPQEGSDLHQMEGHCVPPRGQLWTQAVSCLKEGGLWEAWRRASDTGGGGGDKTPILSHTVVSLQQPQT